MSNANDTALVSYNGTTVTYFNALTHQWHTCPADCIAYFPLQALPQADQERIKALADQIDAMKFPDGHVGYSTMP